MSSICPYPGLRPFTEEESIFFKGRDLHIEQVTAQLEKKKFVMLTGASGDGKSSLIYAGVIPNARAGFFKAKHNNWVFVTFRPERTPLENFARAVAGQMSLDYEEVKKELGYGFSSLVNLYKQSAFFLNQDSDAFKSADETEKKKIKRKAANLFILIDQFEEFFTNPENYTQGVPSNDSQTVINLLLETANLALAQDLPVYIVCTMRSDYIGQCAAFRGLPEMIGFSQFFVPRLKRKEIRQVIADPAVLSGNKISNRLTEVLINELSEGFDQLPVLQHALNALWHISTKLKDAEMDFAHLSMVCGLNPSFLSAEDKEKFDKYLDSKPAFWREYHKEYSLSHVLSTNANLMFEMAHGYYYQEESIISSLLLPDKNYSVANMEDGEKFEKEELQKIVKKTFQCLTRIDEGRAVRNRMTLREITDIISNPKIDCKVVCRTINFYREQGNTFIHPFISEDPESRHLKPETVLDITHESLIRNWGRLRDWAREEYENYLTWQDFHKQLQRWVKSDKSSGYLLPVGPLNYFEEWFNQAKPNKYWLARYDNSNTSTEEKLKNAETALLNARSFINNSARKLFVTRTVMHYGANKVAAFFAIIALALACTYYYFDFRKKQNDAVIERIEERGMELLSSDKVSLENKANFIINYERINTNSFENILNNLDNDSMAFDVAQTAFMISQNYNSSKFYNGGRFVDYMEQRLDNIVNQQFFKEDDLSTSTISRINSILHIGIYINTHVRNVHAISTFKNVYNKNKLINKYSWVLNKLIIKRISHPLDSLHPFSSEISESLQLLALIGGNNPLVELNKITNLVSPFETEKSIARFSKLFPKAKTWKKGKGPLILNNGGYHFFAYLYAALGDVDAINRCIDSLLLEKDNEHYKYWDAGFNDIASCLAIFGGETAQSKIENVTTHYFKTRNGMENIEDDIRWLIDYIYYGQIQDVSAIHTISLTPFLVNNYTRTEIFRWFLNSIGNNSTYSRDEKFFSLALACKEKGIFTREILNRKKESEISFEKAMQYYSQVSKDFKEGKRKWYANQISLTTGPDPKTIFFQPTRISRFIEPNKVIPGERKSTDIYCFLEFLNANSSVQNNFDYLPMNEFSIYKMYDECAGIDRWTNDYRNGYQPRKDFYSFFELARKSSSTSLNFRNFLDLVLINKAFEESDTATAFKIFQRLPIENVLSSSFQKAENIKGAVHCNLLSQLAINLAFHSHTEESAKIISSFEPYLKRNTLLDVAEALLLQNGPPGIQYIQTGNAVTILEKTYKMKEKIPIEYSLLYLDEFYKSKNSDLKTFVGLKILKVLGMVGSQQMYDLAFSMLKETPELLKPRAFINFIKGIIHNGNYYIATQYIPEYISSSKELQLYNEILHHYITSEKLDNSPRWEQYDKDFENSHGLDYETAPGELLKFDSLD